MLPEPLQAFLSTGIQVVFAILPAAPLLGQKRIVDRQDLTPGPKSPRLP
jgi:hypothetical protein